jgi:hypothetical protein
MAADRGVMVAPQGSWCHNNRSAIRRVVQDKQAGFKRKAGANLLWRLAPDSETEGWLG